jgi:DNA-binding MarR family transcriptional regulator
VVTLTVASYPVAHPVLRTWSVFQQTYVLAARYFESVTARFGLSYPQTAVLNVLRQNGRALPLSHIARLLTQEAQSTTELADRLERRGYVRRVRDARDRRLVLLELTDEGTAAIDAILPALQQAGEHLFGNLSEDGLDQLEALLTPIRERAADRLGLDNHRARTAAAE